MAVTGAKATEVAIEVATVAGRGLHVIFHKSKHKRYQCKE